MYTGKNEPPNEMILHSEANERQTTWYFVTNQLNLGYILAAGMIMPPKGFGNKYYQDSLGIIPGWIPLFPANAPARLVDVVTKESSHLKPVVVALNLNSVAGKAKAETGNKTIIDIELPYELKKNHWTIFLPAPLPTRFIECIYFATKEDKYGFEEDAKSYSNVSLEHYKRSVKSKLFRQGRSVWWNDNQHFSDKLNVTMDKYLSAGGIIAMLMNFGNMGEFSTLACKTAFGESLEKDDSIVDDSFVRNLRHWMRKGFEQAPGKISDKIYWGALNLAAEFGNIEGKYKNIQTKILEKLEKTKEETDKYQAILSGLIKDLTESRSMGDKSISELFEIHQNEVSRALILFFLLNNSADLIEFHNKLLSERDYIYAALLFAAREKWIGLPLKLRCHKDMEAAVSHRMCAMAHQILETGISLGDPPPRCSTLRELLSVNPENKSWSKKQAVAALSLARDLKWNCINTKVRIGRGEYKISIDAGGVNIYFPGDIRSIEAEIEKQVFFQMLSKTRLIDKKTEEKVRTILKDN